MIKCFSLGSKLSRSGKPYWFSKYNRVLLHYSVSIVAAAATAAYIPLSASVAAVYIPLSAAAAAYNPRSADLILFSRNTTVRTQT